MVYKLGAVKDHVRDFANSVGPRFGINVVYGWAPGLYDHPKGLALDFMTIDLKNGKAVGDALAAYCVANADALNITYVIWYRQIWTREKGWHKYSGVSPHTDHVHVSFKPVGAFTEVGITTQPVGVVGGIDEAFEKLNDSLGWVTSAGNWKRIGVFAAGVMLLIFAVIRYEGAAKVAKSTVDVAKKVSK